MNIRIKSWLAHWWRWHSSLIACHRLKVESFSIICNSCIGGVIYHKLHHQFQSPFINMYFSDSDLYKLASHFSEYIVKDLVFAERIHNVPVAYLGDIKIVFVHYNSEEEVRQKWNERCKRIDYNHLYFIASDRPNGPAILDDEICSLKDIPCAGKIVFTNRQIPELDYLLPLPKDEDGDYVKTYMLDHTSILDRWRWEKKFDYVYWLNTGKVKKK